MRRIDLRPVFGWVSARRAAAAGAVFALPELIAPWPPGLAVVARGAAIRAWRGGDLGEAQRGRPGELPREGDDRTMSEACVKSSEENHGVPPFCVLWFQWESNGTDCTDFT